MNLEALTKLIGQWQGLIAGIGALVAGLAAIWTPLVSFNPFAWSGPEIAFAPLIRVEELTRRTKKERPSVCSLPVQPPPLPAPTPLPVMRPDWCR